jgi:hypothetical protein
VRGGAGIFYDRLNDDQILIHRELPPLTLTSTATYVMMADLLASPLRITPSGVTAFQKDYDPPAVYNWSLGVQQNLGFGTVLDVSYVGSVGRHLMQRRSLNPFRALFLVLWLTSQDEKIKEAVQRSFTTNRGSRAVRALYSRRWSMSIAPRYVHGSRYTSHFRT